MVKLQVPCGFLEDQQGDRLPFLDPARWERAPEPHGLLCHLNHVQGPRDRAPKCSTQIRTISPEQTNMYTPLCSRMHHCDYVLMRFVYVRISKGIQN